MKSLYSYILTTIFLIVLISCSPAEKSKGGDFADMIITNGKIYTADDQFSIAEAIAIKADSILYIGAADSVKKFTGSSTKVIDLNGNIAVPGLIDSHLHFFGYGLAKQRLDLTKTKSWDEITYLVAAAAAKRKPGEWIIGRGWHQEKWHSALPESFEGYPTNRLLSDASPNNPVILTHASGHAIIANKKAIFLAKLGDCVTVPEGGRIIRDSTGAMTGVFEEEAEMLIFKAYEEYLLDLDPETRKSADVKTIMLADSLLVSMGLTTVHDAGAGLKTIDLLKELHGFGRLNIRQYIMLGEENYLIIPELKKYYMLGAYDDHLTVRAIKRYMDGALGSRGALMFEEYNDLPGHSGLRAIPADSLREIADAAAKNCYQICIHAIGDRGNSETIDLYQSVFNLYGKEKDYRWRIEHAQHLSREDIPRIFENRIIASMQTIHAPSDAPFVIKRLGDRRASSGAYVWRDLIKNGVLICNGTDAPVESPDPIRNFYAAVTRKHPDGGKAFFPAQKMTREEALLSYTKNGAYAGFEENIKGSLETGKLADITILSKDIMSVPDEDILSAEVVYTIIGGRIVYKKK